MTGFVIQGHILGQWLNLVQISLKHFFFLVQLIMYEH